MDRAADRAAKFAFVFDPDDERLMNPLSMIGAISECVHSAGDPKPSSVGEFVRAVYECLALDYRYEIEALERVTGHTVETISMVGGGSRAELLCQMVADATGREVMAGPAEATSMGNALVQLAAAGEIASLQDGRDVVRHSCELRAYHPSDLHREEWARAYERFSGLKSNRRSECV
jgi:rhamnulokinase